MDIMHCFSITSLNLNNLFWIEMSSGEIRTNKRISGNDMKTHPLVILVSDHEEPPLSTILSINVDVKSPSDIKT